MGWLIDAINDWLKEQISGAIMTKFAEIFDNVNRQVGEIATTVGTTPEGWNSGVFVMVRNLSETVILPIVGMILTFVLTYELIQLILEKKQSCGLRYIQYIQVDFQNFCGGVYPYKHI
jgi:hypothetical protein